MNNISNKTLIGVAFIILCSSIESAAQTGGNWPQWRGPNRDGISKETGLLKQWPETAHRWPGRPQARELDIRRLRLPTDVSSRWASEATANTWLLSMSQLGRKPGPRPTARLPQRSWRWPARDSHGRRRNPLCPGW